MRRSVVCAVALLLVSAGSFSRQALADQRVVFGLGGGAHNFSASDDYRGSAVLKKEIGDGTMMHGYLEWYFTGRLGIAIQSNTFYGSASFVAPNSTIGDKLDVTLETTLASVNLILAGTDAGSAARLGLTAGGGPARYRVENVKKGDCPSGFLAAVMPFLLLRCFDSTVSQSHVDGTATFGGLFLDFGGKGFGVRLGMNEIYTDIKPLQRSRVDGAGLQYYFDFRYEFS